MDGSAGRDPPIAAPGPGCVLAVVPLGGPKRKRLGVPLWPSASRIYAHLVGLRAEGRGFEPRRRLPAYTLSRRAPSSARASLRRGFYGTVIGVSGWGVAPCTTRLRPSSFAR
jgi:hypothetical protein